MSRDTFVKHNTAEDKTMEAYFPYRYARIQALKSVYGENWSSWIWRIIDIDELGVLIGHLSNDPPNRRGAYTKYRKRNSEKNIKIQKAKKNKRYKN